MINNLSNTMSTFVSNSAYNAAQAVSTTVSLAKNTLQVMSNNPSMQRIQLGSIAICMGASGLIKSRLLLIML